MLSLIRRPTGALFTGDIVLCNSSRRLGVDGGEWHLCEFDLSLDIDFDFDFASSSALLTRRSRFASMRRFFRIFSSLLTALRILHLACRACGCKDQ